MDVYLNCIILETKHFLNEKVRLKPRFWVLFTLKMQFFKKNQPLWYEF